MSSEQLGELTEDEWLRAFKPSRNRKYTRETHPTPWDVEEYVEYVQNLPFKIERLVDANGRFIIGDVQAENDWKNYYLMAYLANVCTGLSDEDLEMVIILGKAELKKLREKQ